MNSNASAKIPTYTGYPESTVEITEDEAGVIFDALRTEGDAQMRTHAAASAGIEWVLDTLEPQWEGRGSWPRRLTLLDMQWGVVEETLNNQGRETIVTKNGPTWERVS